MIKITRKTLLLTLLLPPLAGYLAFAKWTRSVEMAKIAYDPAHQTCFSYERPVPWRFCIYEDKNGTTQDIVYLLHGRNLDEKTWNDETYYTALLQKSWRSMGGKSPRVVSVSFGPVWLLVPKNSKTKSGLLGTFMNEVLPVIDAQVGKPSRRYVLGESMGGFNALELGLHTQMFQKIAALCPPVIAISPFATWTDQLDFIKKSGADWRTALGIMFLAREYVSNEEEWKAVSPLQLLEEVDPKTAPEIYLSCGLYDKYGSFEGAEQFAERARVRGLRIQWRPLYAGHCGIDIRSVAEFFAK